MTPKNKIKIIKLTPQSENQIKIILTVSEMYGTNIQTDTHPVTFILDFKQIRRI